MLLICCGFVFAQDAVLKWGAWGRGLFLPLLGGGPDPLMTVSESWGANSTRTGINIDGSSANMGMHIDINVNGGSAWGIGDQAKIWSKPFDMVKVQLGYIYDDTFRGNAGTFGAWNWLRYNGMSGEGDIFKRVGEGGEVNFEVIITPVDALYIFAAFGGNGNNMQAASVLAEDAVKNGQYGFGYTIENMGVLRFQYVGQAAVNECQNINAAFKLTAVPNLTVDVGADVPTDSTVALYKVRGAARVDYTMDQLTLHAMTDIYMFESDDLGLEFGVGVDYVVDQEQNINLVADVRYANDYHEMFATTDLQWEDGMIAGMVGVFKGFSNGKIGIGFEVSTTNFAGGQPTKDAYDDVAYCIPVMLEYSF